jgi:hypothetical protein
MEYRLSWYQGEEPVSGERRKTNPHNHWATGGSEGLPAFAHPVWEVFAMWDDATIEFSDTLAGTLMDKQYNH